MLLELESDALPPFLLQRSRRQDGGNGRGCAAITGWRRGGGGTASVGAQLPAHGGNCSAWPAVWLPGQAVVHADQPPIVTRAARASASADSRTTCHHHGARTLAGCHHIHHRGTASDGCGSGGAAPSRRRRRGRRWWRWSFPYPAAGPTKRTDAAKQRRLAPAVPLQRSTPSWCTGVSSGSSGGRGRCRGRDGRYTSRCHAACRRWPACRRPPVCAAATTATWRAGQQRVWGSRCRCPGCTCCARGGG